MLPRSLFGRLVLILLGGVLIAELLTTAVLLRDRGQSLYRLFRDDVVVRTANIVQLIDSMPAEERRRFMPALGGPGMRLDFIGREQVVSSATPAALLLRDQLQRQLAEERTIEVAVSDQPLEPMGRGGPWRGHMMGGMPMRGPMAWMHGERLPSGAFVIQVRLSDGEWLRLQRPVPRELLDWPSRLLWTVVFMLASVLLVSLVAVRWVTRPLRMLSGAANELGRDIERPPLPVDGPEEVAEAARAFNTMQERLGRFIGDRSRILAAVSHDLKTPITRLRLRSELLEDEALREKFRKDLDDMERMVSETLEFMRGTEMSEESQPIDVVALVESLVEDARDAGWEVSFASGKAAPYSGKPLGLRRCLMNLIENAVRYGERAEIAVEESRGSLKITIRDEGPGIDEAELEHLFEPFYRLEGSRSQHTGGSGLGLSIARNIARAHGGDVTLRNRSGGGVEAVVELPR
ncbi:MAG: ATP-binding protein [Gammaproteobacteria bacterium]